MPEGRRNLLRGNGKLTICLSHTAAHRVFSPLRLIRFSVTYSSIRTLCNQGRDYSLTLTLNGCFHHINNPQLEYLHFSIT